MVLSSFNMSNITWCQELKARNLTKGRLSSSKQEISHKALLSSKNQVESHKAVIMAVREVDALGNQCQAYTHIT